MCITNSHHKSSKRLGAVLLDVGILLIGAIQGKNVSNLDSAAEQQSM